MREQLSNRRRLENVESLTRREIKIHRKYEHVFAYLCDGEWQRDIREPSYDHEVCEGRGE